VSYILGQIDFKEYLSFYDKRVDDSFKKKQPSAPTPTPEPEPIPEPEPEPLPSVPHNDSSR
jgi:hypothetical protein